MAYVFLLEILNMGLLFHYTCVYRINAIFNHLMRRTSLCMESHFKLKISPQIKQYHLMFQTYLKNNKGLRAGRLPNKCTIQVVLNRRHA